MSIVLADQLGSGYAGEKQHGLRNLLSKHRTGFHSVFSLAGFYLLYGSGTQTSQE